MSPQKRVVHKLPLSSIQIELQREGQRRLLRRYISLTFPVLYISATAATFALYFLDGFGLTDLTTLQTSFLGAATIAELVPLLYVPVGWAFELSNQARSGDSPEGGPGQ